MKINNRIIVILCVAICSLLIALTIISHFFIFSTFTDIEHKQTVADMQRVLTRLNDDVEVVASICRDWAQREDTSRFVNDPSPEYIQANLAEPGLFRSMKINYIFYYNSSGELVYSQGFNTEDGTKKDVPRELDTIIRNSIIPEGFPEGISGRRGYSLLNGKPVILAGYHIIPSNDRGSARGNLVMVRELDAGQINDLAQQSDLDISLRKISETGENVQSGAILVTSLNNSVIEAAASITGIENSPTMILVTVQSSRYLYQQVQVSIAYIAGVIVILAIILIFVIRWPLKKYIVNPILSIDTSLKTIGRSRDISQQVIVQGDDEIVSLAGSLNRMLGEIHSAQQQTRESESKFRALTENTPDMVFSADLTGFFTYISPQVKNYGFHIDEMVGKPVSDFVFSEDWQEFSENFKKTLEDGNGRSIPFRILDKSQNLHWLEANFTVTSDPEGKRSGVQGMFRDITERRRALDAITLANKKLNLMNDITRHDILNKVTILFGLVDMTRATDSPKERNQFLGEIQEAGLAIYRQIVLTRDYQEVGVKSPQWNPMKEVIAHAISSFSGSGIHFRSEIEHLEIYADPLIEKVIYNLVDNAIRYGKKITTISFSEQISDKGLELIVEDDGIGINAGEKDKIFERGFGNNTGLGLFLSREILMITGITIHESGELAVGARFIITLPKGTYRLIDR